MFRRYPYNGWLLLGLILWASGIYYFHRHTQALLPNRMAESVYKDLKHREDIYEGYLLEKKLISRMFSDSLTESEVQRIDNFPFFIYGYEGKTLKFWNTNIVIAPDIDTINDQPIILHNEKGIFIEKIHTLSSSDNKKLITLFPVFISYPIENNYLRSYFVASKYIPVQTKIIPPENAANADHLITMRGKIKTFCLRFNASDIQLWTPDIWLIIMLLAAIFTTMTWAELVTKYFVGRKKKQATFIVTLSIICLLKLLLYSYGLPFNLGTLDLFSPGLYASSRALSSLGDLFIDIFLAAWIVVFILRYLPYKRYFNKFKSPTVRMVFAGILMTSGILYLFLMLQIIRSTVLDSRISFDVSHFYAINIYTIVGLLIIVAATGISCVVFYVFNVQFNRLIVQKWMKYLLIAIIGTILTIATHAHTDILSWVMIAWYLLFTLFLDYNDLNTITDLVKPEMIYWAALFICGFSMGVLQYFNEIKEYETRKSFVLQRLSPHRDDVMEYSFDKNAKHIAQDKTIKDFFKSPVASTRKFINERFDDVYFSGPINKYQAKLYLFDTAKRPLFNKDTVTYYQLDNEFSDAIGTQSPYLFFKESNNLDRQYYVARIPVYNDTDNAILGYTFIELEMKKSIAETVYPELMQPLIGKPDITDNEYAYAIYINNKLITQTNTYPFSVNLKNDTLGVQQYRYYNHDNIMELHYKVADNRTIIVIHYHSLIIELITLFSYLFVSLILLIIFIFSYRLYVSYLYKGNTIRNFKKLTIQRRLHYSMLGISFLSFSLIGIFTGLYFYNESVDVNKNKLQIATQITRRSVQDYLKHEQYVHPQIPFDSLVRSSGFRYFLTNIASGQKVDVNIFDTHGNLYATSQEEIFDKGLISNKMRSDAYYKLHTEGISIVIQNEKVGDLPYLSLYEPIRDGHATTLAYINVPFFSSEKDLNYQIYNIVVTLINIYAFIFLVSGLVTVGITQRITRSFSMIIRQFEKISLKTNERIEWPDDDEIGKLVSKYNEMVEKVERNAAILAQNEREIAWREMAKQVAHEIKNPLTPMKLNIQYLQQAIRNNEPSLKIINLTDKVTASIISQIDNLAYIATEFSDFAKMPEAREEPIELNEFLNNAMELYANDATVSISYHGTPVNVWAASDRSQMLRVFNNLVENAKQAIPEGVAGKIEVILTVNDNKGIIAVSDNGIGISDATSQKIFQPYFTTKSSGTGLGLAMTKRIIEFWHGTIWYDTEEGKGTTFYVSLPINETNSSGRTTNKEGIDTGS